MSVTFVTIGELTLDDTVLESGELRRAQSGGGALYSALGMRLWGHEVGINAVVGHEYPEEYLQALRDHGIATSGILRIPGWSLRLWLLHEENNRKQQVQKLQASTFAELDAVRPDPPAEYFAAVGYHLSPATPEGQMRSRDVVRAARPDALISLDVLTAPYIATEPYRRGDALQGIDVFSPSIMETEALWPEMEMERLLPMLADFDIRWIAVKMDTRGSIVYDAATQSAWHIPICNVEAVDTTGAGDAFSGGFLEGIALTQDVVEAGLRGTVTASLAVETWGAMGLLEQEPDVLKRRIADLRGAMTRLF
jgi:sugar/nucleoside kinase (ribokinase family)